MGCLEGGGATDPPTLSPTVERVWSGLSGLVWSGLVCLVWSGLVWFGLVWFGLVWSVWYGLSGLSGLVWSGRVGSVESVG